ncbi:Dip2/Utp12 family-domain-containing protein, partial [Blyttiomyces helicus]
DGKQIVATTLDGQICFWDLAYGKPAGTIEGRKDIGGGRHAADRMTAANNSSGKHFTSICFTADGEAVIAGGNSKYVCIYDAPAKMLLKRFQVSHNLSLDAMHEKLNSRNMTEAGPRDLIDETGELSDLEDRIDASLPGVMRGDLSLRKTRPEARTRGVRFSPTGRSWAAASTEGLLVYSLDDALLFDPFDLEIDITEDSILEALAAREHLRALVMAFRLGEQHLVRRVHDAIPANDAALVARDLPPKYLERMLKFLVAHMEKSPRVEMHMLWATALLKAHCRYLKDRSVEFASALRGLQKAIGRSFEEMSKL